MAPTKAELRQTTQRARAQRGDFGIAVDLVLQLVDGTGPVAAYLPFADEPDPRPLLTQWVAAGREVLAPSQRTDPDWAVFDGVGLGPALGPVALARADWIILPGLAGSLRGERLGRGGGWYDRALAYARADAKRVLLLFDDEVYDALPRDDWDEPVDYLATESRVIHS
ncbi:MAG: hypothetical protein LBR20_08720 [Propionibacteriaceae bacterium]|jgi:5-formyltetrahydrofolate cyclo-ligase|nr:hypothetical protein [Propionibacteriaceae bacterium]